MTERVRQLRRMIFEVALLPAAVLLVFAGLLLWQLLYLQRLNAWVDHTDVVIARMNRLERLAIDRSTDLRGFLLSGQDWILRPFEGEGPGTAEALSAMRGLVSDSPSQLAHLDDLARVLRDWDESSARQVARRRAGEPAGAFAADVADGERLLHEVRGASRAFVDVEEGLRAERLAQAQAFTRLVLWTGTLLAAALGALVAMVTARRMRGLIASFSGAIRARDDFVAVASHELKTPLTALQLQLHLAARAMGRDGEGPPRDEMERRFGALQASARRLAELVNRLLDVSRAGHGRLDLATEELDLGQLVQECAARLQDQLAATGSRLEVAAASVTGRWDRLRLESVVTNLLENAIKYGAGAPIEVRVEDGDGRARLRIRDGGIGIPAADQPRIFDRFERAVSPAAYRGLGLGLWLTRAIVEAHGGTIEVESHPGAGSTFTVDLPRTPPAAPT